MVSVKVERQPANKIGPKISDALITSAGVAIERGRNEIDKNCSNREAVTASGPLDGFVRPGRIVEVGDSEQAVWRGMATSCAITIDRGAGSFSADVNLGIERVA